MIAIHIFGAALAFVGLTLFWLDQRKGSQGADESHVEVGKMVNLSGPASLVLILFGILVFVFPFTSFYRSPEDPNPPTTTTIFVASTDSTFGDSTLASTTTLFPIPLAPFDYDIYFDNGCGGNVIEWYQEDYESISGWYISIEGYQDDVVVETLELDTQTDGLLFGNVSALCFSDFSSDSGLFYSIWIYAYNDEGYSDPIYVEYDDAS